MLLVQSDRFHDANGVPSTVLPEIFSGLHRDEKTQVFRSRDGLASQFRDKYGSAITA